MLDLNIKTRESASDAQLKTNVLTNIDLIGADNFIKTRYEVRNDGRQANIVSFGESFRNDPEGILKQMGNGDIFCIKHTLPLFEDIPYKPKYCVILDPREASGTSTLGYKRSDLLKVYPETTYLVASMTHPSVTQTLLERGANVVGWHSACEAMRDPEVAKLVQKWIVGGSCSAMRAIPIARIFGYRRVAIGGFDATIPVPEGYLKEQDEAFKTILAAKGMDIQSEEDYKTFVEELFPAITEYQAVKISKMLPQGQKDPKNPEYGKSDVIKIMDNYFSPDGKHEGMKLGIGDEIMWCSPELAAMARDIEHTFATNNDMVFYNYSGGVAKAIWDVLGGAEKINPGKFQLPKK